MCLQGTAKEFCHLNFRDCKINRIITLLTQRPVGCTRDFNRVLFAHYVIDDYFVKAVLSDRRLAILCSAKYD